MINYEQEVKKKYPTADVINLVTGYKIFNGGIALPQTEMCPMQLSPQSAWQSAYEKLKKEGKI
jgi:hypothetical protein